MLLRDAQPVQNMPAQAGFNLRSDVGNTLVDRLGIVYCFGEHLIKAVYRPFGAELSHYDGDAF